MSAKIRLRLACWDYDRTRPLIDGRVQAEDINLEISVMRPREAFTRMLDSEEYDIAEVSLANYTQLKAKGDTRFVGIPVALSRMFRHSCIYVRAGAGIERPQDLLGRRIGAAQLDSTGIVFIKGMLSNDYGLTPDRLHWFLGGLENPVMTSARPVGHGDVKTIDSGETLVSAFMAGKLDAIISNHLPSPFRAGNPQMLRLFPDFKTVEQDYFRRTGLFPIMHTIAIRSEIHAAHPEVASKVFAAFNAARDLAIADLYDTDALRVALPWLIDAIEESRRVLGPEYWSYGAEPNRKVWEALSQYLVEQGLAQRKATIDELFLRVDRP